jgi:hypothetical protein
MSEGFTVGSVVTVAPSGRYPAAKKMADMELRDYFAGQALIAMVDQYDFEDSRGNEGEGAARCYEWADAMLAERAK